MKVLDLFCGAGGFSEGFKQVGFEVSLGVDIWDKALQTFKQNHGCEVLRADLSERGIEKSLWYFDVVIGGPPCQKISQAQTANPHFKGPYRPDFSLCYRLMEIIQEIKPRFWVMENVRQLRKAFPTCVILNASHFGVPQNRVRAFLANFPLPKGAPPAGEKWKPWPTVRGNDGFNFIRPHMALNGLTPAEAANIDLGLEGNKWLELIKKSVESG